MRVCLFILKKYIQILHSKNLCQTAKSMRTHVDVAGVVEVAVRTSGKLVEDNAGVVIWNEKKGRLKNLKEHDSFL